MMADRRVPQIDGLRALGMLMVYFFHSWQFGGSPTFHVKLFGGDTNLYGFLQYLGTGVDLFMVISGFCLFWPLCKSADTLRTWDWRVYLNRRIRRIVPPYYAAIGYAVILPVLLVALFKGLKVHANWQPVPSTWQLFTHFLFIHSLLPSTWDGITGSFWSLGLEAQFYAIFPLAVFGFRRAGMKAIWAMIIGSIIFRIVIVLAGVAPLWQFIWSLSLLGRGMEFGVGMLTALAVARFWRESRINGAMAGTLQIAGAVALYIVAEGSPLAALLPFIPVHEIVLSMSFALFVFALCTSPTPLSRLFRNPVLDWLGGISYSIYLIHQPTAWYFSEFLKKVMHVQGPANFYLLATAGFATVVAIAYPFFLVFEKPGLTMNRPRKKRDEAPSPEPAPAPARPMEKLELGPAFARSNSVGRSA